MTNYICINGNKTELTEEQLKQLGIEIPKANPFERVKLSKGYYCITGTGKVIRTYDMDDMNDRECHKVGNYCTDASLLQQRALHETLSRLLWRYSMEHDGDKIDWNISDQRKHYIFVDVDTNQFHVDHSWTCCGIDRIYFYSKRIAEDAIEEIIKPFMAQHPEFKF
jgi:hypothetical protein